MYERTLQHHADVVHGRGCLFLWFDTATASRLYAARVTGRTQAACCQSTILVTRIYIHQLSTDCHKNIANSVSMHPEFLNSPRDTLKIPPQIFRNSIAVHLVDRLLRQERHTIGAKMVTQTIYFAIFTWFAQLKNCRDNYRFQSW